MISWDLQPLGLLKAGACIVPMAIGCCAAGALALRHGMHMAERFWLGLTRAAVAAIGVCLLSALLLWAMMRL